MAKPDATNYLKIRPGLVLSALTDDSLLLSLRSASLEDVVK